MGIFVLFPWRGLGLVCCDLADPHWFWEEKTRDALDKVAASVVDGVTAANEDELA